MKAYSEILNGKQVVLILSHDNGSDPKPGAYFERLEQS